VQRRVSAIALLPFLLFAIQQPATSTFMTGRSSFHNRHGWLRPSRVERKLERNFFNGESEVERLRQENAELKQKLERSSKLQDWAAGVSNLCSRAVEGVKAWFNGKEGSSGAPTRQRGREVDWFSDSDSRDLSLLPSRSFAPSLLGSLFGSIFKLAFGDVSSNVDAVRATAAEAVMRSGRLGPSPRTGPVVSQSYSSININGMQTSSVSLQFQMTGESRQGIVSCQATIAGGEVNVNDIRLDGSRVEISAASGFIDV